MKLVLEKLNKALFTLDKKAFKKEILSNEKVKNFIFSSNLDKKQINNEINLLFKFDKVLTALDLTLYLTEKINDSLIQTKLNK